MEIENATIEGVAVVRCSGKLDTNTSSQAQDQLNKLIEEGSSKLLVDFDKVDFVSSAGLRILLATAKRLNTSGGSLRISGLNDTVNEIFEMSGFSTILDVFPTESDALKGY